MSYRALQAIAQSRIAVSDMTATEISPAEKRRLYSLIYDEKSTNSARIKTRNRQKFSTSIALTFSWNYNV